MKLQEETDKLILLDVSNGIRRTETAKKVGKSIRTVERRLELLRAKFGAETVAHLMATVIRKKVIE